MGSTNFITSVRIEKKATDSDAFQQARSDSQFENGHGGYTGTLAEKGSFVNVGNFSCAENAKRFVEAIESSPWDENSSEIALVRSEILNIYNDKHAPALMVRHPIDAKTDGAVFFGFASC